MTDTRVVVCLSCRHTSFHARYDQRTKFMAIYCARCEETLLVIEKNQPDPHP